MADRQDNLASPLFAFARKQFPYVLRVQGQKEQNDKLRTPSDGKGIGIIIISPKLSPCKRDNIAFFHTKS